MSGPRAGASLWLVALAWALPFALWLYALGGSTIYFGYGWQKHHANAQSWEDTIQRGTDNTPEEIATWHRNLAEDRNAAWTALGGLVGVDGVLLAMIVGYRRFVSSRWRATWRGWVLALVVSIALGVGGTLLVVSALAGSIRG